MCKSPYFRGVVDWPCLKCLPCMINRQRLWALRLVLESTQHPFSYFVTLTYNEEHLPKDGCVDPRTLCLFLKRLRERLAPERLRFFAVGEYGKRGLRPHYHLALFCSVAPELLRPALDASWSEKGESIGFIHVGALTQDSALYVAKYVAKGWTKKGDRRLQGKHPEFVRMSLRPYGIGGSADVEIARAAKAGRMDGVPRVLRFDGRLLPIGRYLRGRVANRLGILKKKFRRGAEPLDVELLVKQMQLKEPGALAKREVKRAYSSLVAEQRHARKTQRELL